MCRLISAMKLAAPSGHTLIICHPQVRHHRLSASVEHINKAKETISSSSIESCSLLYVYILS